MRDLLLGRERRSDVDATTDARPNEIKAILDGWADAIWTQGERFGTIGARHGGQDYEITTHRAEAYTSDSRKPDVVFADAIEADLSRRDFTVNAMALELTVDDPSLVDPFGGATDLAARDTAHAPPTRGELQRRPAPHAAGGPLPRRLRPQTGRRADRGRHRHAVTPVDRLRRAHPGRAGQAPHGRPPGRWPVVRRSTPAWPRSSCPSCRPCGSSRTRSTGTRTS